MFHLFRKNSLYNKNIDPHCAYCSHCKPENEHQGLCEFRGIVALAGNCRRFEYDALRRIPAKPARIRGRFSDDDFFFEPLLPIEPETTPDELTEDRIPGEPDGKAAPEAPEAEPSDGDKPDQPDEGESNMPETQEDDSEEPTETADTDDSDEEDNE